MTATAEHIHHAGKGQDGIKGLYIEGAWQQASDGGTTVVRCPADGREVAVVASCTVEDAERAIASARAAFEISQHGLDTAPWTTTNGVAGVTRSDGRVVVYLDALAAACVARLQ